MARNSKPPKKNKGQSHSQRPHRPTALAPGTLPTREQLMDFVRATPEKVGKREIARAFGIKGGDRIGLKQLLTEMVEDGTLSGNRKEIRESGSLPPVGVIEIIGRDGDGDLVGSPVVWDHKDGDRPKILVLPSRNAEDETGRPPGMGDRMLVRISRVEGEDIGGLGFEAKPIKRLPRERGRPLGIFRAAARGGGTIEPIDRKELRAWTIQPGDDRGARDGDLVRYDLSPAGRFGVPQARIAETLGNPDDQRQISLIAIHAHGLRDEFPERVLEEVERLAAPDMKGREDLTGLPLLTIDPIDARDHDDAVFAEPDTAPNNPGGYVVVAAIADVAHYVRPGTRLDREAQMRGNSVYFPDRVVPMLPERISNDLCSLREGERRPCLAVRMVIDSQGEKRSHTFMRAMMRSMAKLSYQEAQAAFDGAPSVKCAHLMDTALRPLWAAYKLMAAARDRRAPLDLDLPERKIVLDQQGRVAGVTVPERLDAHRLIEEMMIQANVAAAETLEQRRHPVVYRVHAEPSKEKLIALSEFLETLDMHLPKGTGTLRPAMFNRILQQAKDQPVPDLVNEVVLRAQSQAEYAIENIGHFGLNLRRYAHFTSPIRRYADLVVHRSLVAALSLGEGRLDDDDVPRLAEVSRHISQTERIAMAAERETVDRLIATHLAGKVGAEFDGRIAGVTRSGLFVRLNDSGADGFVPASTLGHDYYQHVEALRALVSTRSGVGYHLGDKVRVRLVEAIPSAGALRFEMLSEGRKGHASLAKGGRIGRSTPLRNKRQPRFRR
jgi:ribonuclease R